MSDDAVITRHVQAIEGFSWGFTITGGDITLAPPAALRTEAWDSKATEVWTHPADLYASDDFWS